MLGSMLLKYFTIVLHWRRADDQPAVLVVGIIENLSWGFGWDSYGSSLGDIDTFFIDSNSSGA